MDALHEYFKKRSAILNLSGIEREAGMQERSLVRWVKDPADWPISAINRARAEEWAKKNGFTPPAPRKVTTMTADGKIRLKMVQRALAGEDVNQLAAQYRYEYSAVNYYVRKYQTEGPAALNVERRREYNKATLPKKIWDAIIAAETDQARRERYALLFQVQLKKLSLAEAAKQAGISTAMILRHRREVFEKKYSLIID